MEISEIKQDFNVAKMCRLCLIETEEEMQEIFSETSSESEILTILNLISSSVLVSSLFINFFFHLFLDEL
jgi:hypothetical protein